MRLSCNIATRQRPDLLRQTIETTLRNVSLSATTVMVSVDADDETSAKIANEYLAEIAVSIEPREDSLGEKYNRVLKVAPADIYMPMVDYAPVITKGFDAKVIEAASVYPDGYACVVGPLANLSFACVYAVTHKFAEKTGGIFPPYFPYWFIDHWLDDVARMTDRMVLGHVVTDFWSRRPGTMERREPGFWGTFFDRMAWERERQANAVIDASDFDETPARKLALKRNFPLFHQRSAMINDNCRSPQMPSDPSRDERYHRIKGNAVRILETVTAKAA